MNACQHVFILLPVQDAKNFLGGEEEERRGLVHPSPQVCLYLGYYDILRQCMMVCPRPWQSVPLRHCLFGSAAKQHWKGFGKELVPANAYVHVHTSPSTRWDASMHISMRMFVHMPVYIYIHTCPHGIHGVMRRFEGSSQLCHILCCIYEGYGLW